MSPEQTEQHKSLLSSWYPFLSQPDLKGKREFAGSRSYHLIHPDRPPKVAEGTSDFSSGYYDIHFDNRNNFRDEEWRDVWITYGCDLKRPERNWPSESLHESTNQLFHLFWEASLSLLLLIETAISVPRGHLLNCLTVAEGEQNPFSFLSPDKSAESNFAIIHYYDNAEGKKVKKVYDGPQRCMVHRDSGFLTLLPRATQPGIQALCNQLSGSTSPTSSATVPTCCWVDMEKYTKDNEVIVYTGRMLEMKTEGKVRPLIHRVVRYPGLVRLSSPFEAKPGKKAVIAELEIEDKDGGEKKKEVVEAGVLDKGMTWDSLQRTVMRADGIPPEEHSKNLNGAYAPYLVLYGDTAVANE